MAKILHQQRAQIFLRHLPEKRIQTVRQRPRRKTRRLWPFLQREFAKWIILLQPVFRRVAQHPYQRRRWTAREVSLAIALERLARVRDQRGRQLRFRRQVRDEIIRQVHLTARRWCALIYPEATRPT